MSRRDRHKEKKIDQAVDLTFPASDPIAAGAATGTEPPRRPVDRKAPVMRKEDIEQAQRGSRHPYSVAARSDESQTQPVHDRPTRPWLIFVAFAALLLILGSAATFLVEGWQRAGGQMSIHDWIAVVLGIVFRS
jgi:hypothetical protein